MPGMPAAKRTAPPVYFASFCLSFYLVNMHAIGYNRNIMIVIRNVEEGAIKI